MIQFNDNLSVKCQDCHHRVSNMTANLYWSITGLSMDAAIKNYTEEKMISDYTCEGSQKHIFSSSQLLKYILCYILMIYFYNC